MRNSCAYPKVSTDTIVQSTRLWASVAIVPSKTAQIHSKTAETMEIEQTNSMVCEPYDASERRIPCRGLRRSDRPLDPARELPLGAHMVTPRRGYTHHGIYVGEGRVIQYGGLSWGLRRGPVEEVPLSQFSQGRAVWVRVVGSHWFDQYEVVRRARLRLGEDRYSALTNNCEHFCEWCVRGQHRSYQVDDRIAGYSGLLLRLIELLARGRPRQSIGDRFIRRMALPGSPNARRSTWNLWSQSSSP
jgi:hypothetical protein